MQKSEIIGCLEAGVGDTRVEVVLCEGDGGDVVTLQLSTWHETLGWQRQKTIPLPADKIGQLQRLLSHARNHIEDRNIPAGALAQVIEFARGSRSQTALSASQSATQADDRVKSAIN
ncbi:MAG: hypothetical protein L0220_25510 [Acidobacteria bacterium]|nr:hypothetical protein [Acidobacteriota bacterium]